LPESDSSRRGEKRADHELTVLDSAAHYSACTTLT
jgi:hypothetical protein